MRRTAQIDGLLVEIRRSGNELRATRLRLRPRADGTFRVGVVSRGLETEAGTEAIDYRTEDIVTIDPVSGRIAVYRYTAGKEDGVLEESDGDGELLRRLSFASRVTAIHRCCWDVGVEAAVVLAGEQVFLVRPNKQPMPCPGVKAAEVFVADFRGIGRDAILAVAAGGEAILWDCESHWRGALSPATSPSVSEDTPVEACKGPDLALSAALLHEDVTGLAERSSFTKRAETLASVSGAGIAVSVVSCVCQANVVIVDVRIDNTSQTCLNGVTASLTTTGAMRSFSNCAVTIPSGGKATIQAIGCLPREQYASFVDAVVTWDGGGSHFARSALAPSACSDKINAAPPSTWSCTIIATSSRSDLRRWTSALNACAELKFEDVRTHCAKISAAASSHANLERTFATLSANAPADVRFSLFDSGAALNAANALVDAIRRENNVSSFSAQAMTDEAALAVQCYHR